MSSSMSQTTQTVECPKCAGTGRIADQKALGRKMRERRDAAGLNAKEVAGRMNIHPTYLSDLERGTRNWNDDLIQRFEKAIERKGRK